MPKLSESAHELVDEAGPGPASKLTCACVHAIDILLIYSIYHIMLHSLTGYTSIGSSSGVSASASEDLRGPVRPPPDELVPDVPVPARERGGV